MAGLTPSSANVLGFAGAVSVDVTSTSAAPSCEMVLRICSVASVVGSVYPLGAVTLAITSVNQFSGIAMNSSRHAARGR